MYYYYLFFCFNFILRKGGVVICTLFPLASLCAASLLHVLTNGRCWWCHAFLLLPPPPPLPPTASALLSFGGKNCCFRSGDPMRSRLRMAAACSEQVEHLEIYRIPTWFSPQNEGGGGVVWHCITSLIFSSHNPQTPPPPPHPVESVKCYP